MTSLYEFQLAGNARCNIFIQKISKSDTFTSRYFMKKIILALLLFPLLTNAQVTESNYRVYSVKSGREIPLSDIVEDMKDYNVLFFGEEHNDSVTHFLEKTIFELMYAKYNSNLALSMEMFDRDVQPVMNEFLKGFLKDKHFNKDARVWSNYRDYKPMIEFARLNTLDVVCANAASRYTNLAGRKGQEALAALPDESKKFFAPLPYDTATGAYYEKLTGLSDHAAGSSTDTAKAKMPPTAWMGAFSLVTAQSLWDATMAWSISEYLKKNKGKKIMQVNGKFHSDEGFAIVTQLHKYSPKCKSLVISTATDDAFPNIKWEEYKKMGNYIIITDPKVPRTYKD
jgi:uncharacterized iron-regulated protein